MYQQLETKTWKPTQIHSDLQQRVAINAKDILWQATPYPGIWFGCYEANDLIQEHPLTMLTRFDPGGYFPSHDHPNGEEILVVQGTFADETGQYSAGSYLLNPEGFNHCPYSPHGCITFVKLRHHGGKNRKQIRTNINLLPWVSSLVPQIKVKLLYQQMGFPETVRIERWQPETTLSRVRASTVREIFVLEGTWADELGEYSAGAWLRYPAGCVHTPSSPTGCALYVKTY